MKFVFRLASLLMTAALLVSATGCCCTGVLPKTDGFDLQSLIPGGCEHEFAEATCQAPATCTLCGETEGEVLPHAYYGITCTMCGDKLELVTDPKDPAYYCVSATGEYSDDITLPMLENPHVTVMMSIDWSYLESINTDEDPLAQVHATNIWRTAYAAQNGDIEIITVSDDQQTDFLATQSASGTAPDIVSLNYDLTYPRWSATGLTAAMESYADHLDLYNDELYNRDLMEQYFLWGGQSHGLITMEDVDRQYIVYNKTKFEQAGQATPLAQWQQGKWNWTAFVKTAKAMTGGDDYGFTGWGLFPYFAPYPMATLDDTTGKVTLAIDDGRYMRYMTEVYQLYQVKKAARCDWALQSWNTMFPAGTDAMVQTSLAGYKHIVEAADRINGDEFGIAPVPVFDPAGETESISSASLWAYGISAKAANPVAAATYIRLETMVGHNISDALEGNTWYDTHLTEDEKAMLEETADDPICVDMIRGIGDCYFGIIDASIVPNMYYTDTKDPVQTIFDSQRKALEAEFDKYNKSLQ